MIQAHIFYSGRVQGVGFRFTVQQYALDLGLTGWVRNLPDGRVEVLLEGDNGTIEQLMNSIERYFGSSIKNKQVAFEKSQGRFKDFQVAF